MDRYVVRQGLITQMDVWNDSAEWLLSRARRLTMPATYLGPLPDHGRFGYRP